jgi:asparagine synthetase B (glutamine-hydrolysing)
MAVGLEGRVALLDDALVRLAERTPERRMMSLRRGKIILRDLAERYGAAVSSLKRGFAVPLGEYFVGPWRCDAREWFHSAETDFVDRRSAIRLLDERIHPASDLWMLATLIAWENLLKSVRTAAGRDATNLQAAPA